MTIVTLINDCILFDIEVYVMVVEVVDLYYWVWFYAIFWCENNINSIFTILLIIYQCNCFYSISYYIGFIFFPIVFWYTGYVFTSRDSSDIKISNVINRPTFLNYFIDQYLNGHYFIIIGSNFNRFNWIFL